MDTPRSARARPTSVWDAGIGVRKVGKGPFPTEKEAVVAVQEEACRRLALRAAEMRTPRTPSSSGAQELRHLARGRAHVLAVALQVRHRAGLRGADRADALRERVEP